MTRRSGGRGGAGSPGAVSSASSAGRVVAARLHETDVRVDAEVVVEPQSHVAAVQRQRHVETSVVARRSRLLAQPQQRQYRTALTFHFNIFNLCLQCFDAVG